MSDCVAVIENTSPIRLPLIRGNHLRFDLAGSFDCVDNRRFIEFQQRRNLSLQKGKKPFIGDDAVFNHFGETGNPLAMWQSA